MSTELPWPASEIEAIGPDEPRCGYSHDDHVHPASDAHGNMVEHRLVCLRRAGHEGATRAVDVHIGRMPDGQYVQFAEPS